VRSYGIIEAGTGEVRGLRLRCGAARWSLEHFASANISSEIPLSESLTTVYTELDAGRCDFIAVTGNLTGAGCFELYMPRLRFPQMIFCRLIINGKVLLQCWNKGKNLLVHLMTI